MSPNAAIGPVEVVREFLGQLVGFDWHDRKASRDRLSRYLVNDLYEGEYEVFGVPENAWILQTNDKAESEIIVQTFGRPFKAKVVLSPDGNWRIAAFWMECTGCLGSGAILNGQCSSCLGTGWGLRAHSDTQT